MSHCPQCPSDWPNSLHRGTTTNDCPGCGHEDVVTFDPQRPAYRPQADRITALEAQVAEAEAELTTMREEHAIWEIHGLVQIVKERDALRARIVELEQRFELEVHQQVDMQTRALQATLEQAREVVTAAREFHATYRDAPWDLAKRLGDALAALDAGKEAPVDSTHPVWVLTSGSLGAEMRLDDEKAAEG